MKNNKGFTLIELMAVVIIIGLIAILTIPNIVNQIKKGKEAINNNINDIVISAAKKYVNDNKNDYIKDSENTYCILISSLVSNDYIKEDIVNNKQNNIIEKKVKITYNEQFEYNIVNENDCTERDIYKISAVERLLLKSNDTQINDYSSGNVHEMYGFNHDETYQTPALTDYRYIGNKPYNYVKFNDELWRIIGVFEIDDGSGNREKRIKIMRDQKLADDYYWDSTNLNRWELSSLKTYLNTDYYDSLSSQAKSMIDPAVFYIGGINAYPDGEMFYGYERGNEVYNNSYLLNWLGIVGLINPSDFIFTYALGVNEEIYNYPKVHSDGTGSWMYGENHYTWVINPRSVTSRGAFFYSAAGIELQVANINYSVVPTVYLKSDIRFKSGIGSINKPYKLSMD